MSTERDERVDGVAQRVERRRGGALAERTRRRATSPRNGPGRPGSGSRKIRAVGERAERGGSGRARPIASSSSGDSTGTLPASARSSRSGSLERGRARPRRGSRTAPRSASSRWSTSAARSSGPVRRIASTARWTASGQPPVALTISSSTGRTAGSVRTASRRSRSSGGDGEVGRGHPGDVAGRPEAGEPHRRLVPARQHEVELRRQAEDQRLEKALDRVAGRGVGVVDRDDRVGDGDARPRRS